MYVHPILAMIKKKIMKNELLLTISLLKLTSTN